MKACGLSLMDSCIAINAGVQWWGFMHGTAARLKNRQAITRSLENMLVRSNFKYRFMKDFGTTQVSLL
jgi:hypothetical protein